MRWDRFFDDLEDQLASEWEAERAALDTEAERLRLSRLELRDRWSAIVGAEVALDLIGGGRAHGAVEACGVDWVAVGHAGARVTTIVPADAIASVGMPHAELLRAARPAAARPVLNERMTLGFVLRDLVRRRVGVVIQLRTGVQLAGTIDRAGADHLDLALHDPGGARRTGEVTGYRIVPFTALAAVRVEPGDTRA